MTKHNVIRDDDGQLDYEEWVVGDRRHRIGNPCYKEYFSNGQVCYEDYRMHGELHNPDGPAIIEYYKDGTVHCEQWIIHGKRHRYEGPAYIDYNIINGEIDRVRWYINGKAIDHKPAKVFPLTLPQQIELKLIHG